MEADQHHPPRSPKELQGPHSFGDAEVALRVYGLGRLRVSFGRVPVHFPTQKAQDLLCFLLLRAGEELGRDVIAEWLWPMRSAGKARRSLSTSLWRLRQVLASQAPSAVPYILSERDSLAFNTAALYWFDVDAFEELASFGLSGPLPCTEDRQQALEEAMDTCGGDLLEGCYDDWCLSDRERLRLLLLRVLKRLQCHCRLSSKFDVAVTYGRRLLHLDPLQEDVHRELMRCYLAAGQRSLALEQFQQCRDTLRRELHAEPMQQTWLLYQQIRQGQEPASQEDVSRRYASLQAGLARFRYALDVLESAWQVLWAVTTEAIDSKGPLADETSPPEQDEIGLA